MSITAILLRWLYSLLLFLAIPAFLLRIFWRSLKLPAYRKRMWERFGFFDFSKPTPVFWLHAVSLGESIAATPLIRAFQSQFPTIPIVVTTMTPTGANQIQKTFGREVTHLYFPFDLSWCVERFIKKIQPRLLVIMETELWPNCLWVCRKHNIPVIMANARLSERSFKGYQRVAVLTRAMLHCVTVVAAQSKQDGDRFLALGLDKKKLHIAGNVKFDITLPENLKENAAKLRNALGNERPIWIAASTHAGEEEQILTVFNAIRKAFPNALLILVPRHPERFQEVYTLAQHYGNQVITRSSGLPSTAETTVFLGNTLGELSLFYAVSDIAFVGGSLVPVGGHNMLEAAAAGIPIVVGPHVHNFQEISALLLKAKAMVQVNNAKQLQEIILSWLTQSKVRQEMGEAGKQVVLQNRGAVEKIMVSIRHYL